MFRTNTDLNIFCVFFPQYKIKLFTSLIDDVFVQFISGGGNAFPCDNAVKRDNRDLGQSATKVDDHVSNRDVDIHARANGRCHAFFDKVDLTRTSREGGVFNGLSFDLGLSSGTLITTRGRENTLNSSFSA